MRMREVWVNEKNLKKLKIVFFKISQFHIEKIQILSKKSKASQKQISK